MEISKQVPYVVVKFLNLMCVSLITSMIDQIGGIKYNEKGWASYDPWHNARIGRGNGDDLLQGPL